jgi:hypothetical protein
MRGSCSAPWYDVDGAVAGFRRGTAGGAEERAAGLREQLTVWDI